MGMNAVVQPLFQPDTKAMTQHVEHLFGGYLDGCHDGLIELSWTDTTPDEGGRYRLRHARMFGTDSLDELVEEAARLNAQAMCNVYIGAALRHPDTAPFGRGTDRDAWALTCAYVDLDDAESTANAKSVYGLDKPTLVVVTGREPHTRAQMWWRLEEPLTDANQWPALLRGFAARMKGDTTVTNPSRVMRLAGSIAWPVKPGRSVELTGIAPLKEPGRCEYAAEHLAREFPPVAVAPTLPITNAQLNHTVNSLGLTDKLIDGRESYMRNTISACLIELIGTTGATPTAQELYDVAWPQYERKVDLTRGGRGAEEFAQKCAYTIQRFERGDIRGIETLDKAVEVYQRKEARKTAPAPKAPPSVHQPRTDGAVRFPFETVAMLRKLPAPLWLAKNWVPEGATGIFYGKWAAGKSFIGFDFLLHLAYGFKEWHGVSLPGEPCDVLVLAREGHHGFVNRIDAFKKHHGITDDTDRVKFMRAAVSFMRDEEFNGLLDAIKEQQTPFRAVLVDTVARVLPGTDMNEQQVVTLFMERLQILGSVTGAASIGVHHENKNGGMMGSIYFEANADFVFEITRAGEEDEPLTRGEIMCTKQKDGEDRWKRAVKYQKVELSIVPDGPSSLVVESIGESKEAAQGAGWPDREMCRRVLNAIEEAWHQGKPWSSYVHAKKFGRYAPALMSSQFKIHPRLAEQMIEAWMMNDILSVEIRDKNTKAKGLKVVGQL
jgi:hypothetical protein